MVLEAAPAALTTICVFEDRASLEQADRLFEASLQGYLAGLYSGEPEITTGEIVYQRGM